MIRRSLVFSKASGFQSRLQATCKLASTGRPKQSPCSRRMSASNHDLYLLLRRLLIAGDGPSRQAWLRSSQSYFMACNTVRAASPSCFDASVQGPELYPMALNLCPARFSLDSLAECGAPGCGAPPERARRRKGRGGSDGRMTHSLTHCCVAFLEPFPH